MATPFSIWIVDTTSNRGLLETFGGFMTKDNWIKAFDEFAAGNEIGPGLETMIGKRGMRNIKSFISQVEKDAIEKTNKRWQLRLEEAKRVAIQVARSFIIDREVGIPHQNPLNEDLYVKYLNGEIDSKISDLLEYKERA